MKRIKYVKAKKESVCPKCGYAIKAGAKMVECAGQRVGMCCVSKVREAAMR